MSVLLRPLHDYMAAPVRTISIDAGAVDADRLLRRHDISCLAVVDRAGRPAGVITRTDLLRAARAVVRRFGQPAVLELPALAVRDLMTAHVVTLGADASIAAAADELVERHIHRLFVRDQERLVGVVSTKEIIRAVLDARLAPPLFEYMSRPVVSVDVRDPIALAVERLGQSALSGLVVLEGALPVGLFTQREVLESRGQPTSTAVEEAMSQAMLALPQETPLFRAAGFTVSTRARRVLAVEHHHVKGILTGLDFARAVVDASGPEGAAAIA